LRLCSSDGQPIIQLDLKSPNRAEIGIFPDVISGVVFINILNSMTIHRLSLRTFCEPLLRPPKSFCSRTLPSRTLLSFHAISTRNFHRSPAARERDFDPRTIERQSDEVDVCIVGGGPAGLSAAIRLKQLAEKDGREIRVLLLEKGSEMGTHNPTHNSRLHLKSL
jgi:hypothetical protein